MAEKIERRALLNTLKIASTMDPERMQEMQKAAMGAMRVMGWTYQDDAWMIGPLLEIAAKMAQTMDKVDERLPDLASWVSRSGIPVPKQWGLDVDQGDSLTLSALSVAGRVHRMVEVDAFGMPAEDARNWCMESITRAAEYLFEELEILDASASPDPRIGGDGRRMVLQASLREAANLFEPIWFSESAALASARARLNWDDLRQWLDGCPENDALARINVRYGDAVDRVMVSIESARESVMTLQGKIMTPQAAASESPGAEDTSQAAHGVDGPAVTAPAAAQTAPSNRREPQFRNRPR